MTLPTRTLAVLGLGLGSALTGCGDTHTHIHKASDAPDGDATTELSDADDEDEDGDAGDSGGSDGTDPAAADADADGYSAADGDCDDADATVFPGATDSAVDGTDQDCDGVDGPDEDGDGVAAESAGGTDCDDTDGSVYPGATDHPDDGVDQDCDGVLAGESPEETAVLSEIVLDYSAYCAGGVYRLTAWDWDDDGYEDLIVSDGYTARSYILRNAGAWSLGWTSPVYYHGPSYYDSARSNFGYAYLYGLDHLVGDWDGDGLEELLLVGAYQDAYAWDGALFRRTDGLGTARGSYQMSIAPIDFDGDGTTELLTGQRNAFTLYDYDGQILTPLGGHTGSYAGFSHFEVADFDGDGIEEALSAAANTRYEGTFLNLLDFDGSVTPSVGWSDEDGNSEIFALRSGDLDNDGDLDVLTLGRSGAWVYLNDGTGAFSLSWISPEAVEFDDGALADLNGDGLLDIVLPSELRRFSVYLNDGAGGFTDVVHDFHGQGRAVAVHDFDGDGFPDISFVNFEHAGVTSTGRDTCTITTVRFSAE